MLSDQVSKSLQQKATVNYETLRTDVGAYLRTQADDRWRSTFAPLVRAVVADQAANWSAELGVRFDVVNLDAVGWFESYTLNFAQPILATTEQDLSDLLLRAQLEGWGNARMRNAIGVLFDRYASNADLTDAQRQWFGDRMPAYRRDRIARTESMTAANSGSFALLADWGAPFKEWLDTPDSRTRDSHRDAGRRYREGGDPGPIPMSEPFKLGDHFLMYPHDPAAPADETINCRCTLAPWFPENYEVAE